MAETEIVSAIPASEKRIVVQYTSGPLKNMFRIVGRTTEVLPFLSAANGLDIEFASLIKVCPHYILYKESLPNMPIQTNFQARASVENSVLS